MNPNLRAVILATVAMTALFATVILSARVSVLAGFLAGWSNFFIVAVVGFALDEDKK